MKAEPFPPKPCRRVVRFLCPLPHSPHPRWSSRKYRRDCEKARTIGDTAAAATSDRLVVARLGRCLRSKEDVEEDADMSGFV
jgi:hypothetical protein